MAWYSQRLRANSARMGEADKMRSSFAMVLHAKPVFCRSFFLHRSVNKATSIDIADIGCQHRAFTIWRITNFAIDCVDVEHIQSYTGSSILRRRQQSISSTTTTSKKPTTTTELWQPNIKLITITAIYWHWQRRSFRYTAITFNTIWAEFGRMLRLCFTDSL